MTGLHREVTLSFMLVGHTKFAPDWCFGLFKQRYRRTFVSSLHDITEVVNTSADVNVAQLVGTQNGNPVVPVYNSATYLAEHYRNVPQMKSYRHFNFSASTPGVVVMKEFSDSAETSFTMLSDEGWTPSHQELPSLIKPTGLPLTRQWYLYNQIREYCRDGTQDITCPKPSVPVSAEPSNNEDGPEERSDISSAPPTKKARRCGLCGNPGHTRRTCKNT